MPSRSSLIRRYTATRTLPSFPTRRSSDLAIEETSGALAECVDGTPGGADACGMSPVRCHNHERRATVTVPRDAAVVEIGRHTSELQSQSNLVCRLLLEKKNEDHTAEHQSQ